MNLGDRSDGDRPRVEFPKRQAVRERYPERRRELPPPHRGLARVERFQAHAHGLGEDVAAGGEDLAELGRQRTGALGDAHQGVADRLPGKLGQPFP